MIQPQTSTMTGAGWTEEQVLVLGAGHLVPMDQPLSAVVTRFSQLRNLGMMELGFFDIAYIYIYVCVYEYRYILMMIFQQRGWLRIVHVHELV